jgi:hypothetical protein
MLCNIRKYLFSQKYTHKEMCINWMAIIMFGIGSGVAIPVIIENIMGKTLDTKAESLIEVLPLLFFFILYILIFYPIFYYISKFIVKIILYICSLFNNK